MANSMWVTLHMFLQSCSMYLSLMTNSLMWVTWLHILWKQSHCHILSYDQQQVVSDIAHFVKGSLVTSFPMTNSKWVTLHILWKAVSSHLFPWLTASEWHCTFCEGQSHHIFSYDQQLVSDIAHFVKYSFITSFPITNSMWVTLHILWKIHLFLSPTGSEWLCTFCERQSHHIFSYHQQRVSDIVHFVKGSLITSFPITHSLWVTLYILWWAALSHLFLHMTNFS